MALETHLAWFKTIGPKRSISSRDENYQNFGQKTGFKKYDTSTSHQSFWNWGIHRWTKSKGIHLGCETEGRRHQKRFKCPPNTFYKHFLKSERGSNEGDVFFSEFPDSSDSASIFLLKIKHSIIEIEFGEVARRNTQKGASKKTNDGLISRKMLQNWDT